MLKVFVVCLVTFWFVMICLAIKYHDRDVLEEVECNHLGGIQIENYCIKKDAFIGDKKP